MAKIKRVTKNDEKILTMTQSAFDDLQKELTHRISVLRKDIADEISAARELGDLSENHAYTVAMEKKEMNENRILEIEDILAIAQIVTENRTDNYVSIGEEVEIENVESKQKRTIILVGNEDSKTANPLVGKISVDSPIGKAVYNSKIGEEVEVDIKGKIVKYKVLRLLKAA